MPPTSTGNAEARRLGAPPYADVGVPFGAHPPPAVMLVAALTPLGFENAALAWLALSLLALAVTAWVSVRAVAAVIWRVPHDGENDDKAGASGTTPTTPPTIIAALVFVTLTCWPPVLHNLEKGQWSVLIAGLLAAAWWARTHRRDGWAGALVVLAGSFKVMPILALVAFMGGPAARRRRVLLGAAAAAATIVGASTLLLGPGAWVDFAAAAPANTRGWQTGPANTLSLWGALARLLVGGPFARPIISAPEARVGGLWLSTVLWAAAAVVLVRRAARSTVGPAVATVGATSPSERDEGCAFAAWCALAVILGPLSWSHAAASLALPMALLSTRVPTPLLAAAAVMLTIPRFTLFAWAGPLPVGPGRGLFLATHLTAAALIFILATRKTPGRAAREVVQPGAVA